MSAPDTLAPEQTGFELERFHWSGPDRLEVEGRWFGVRGRRFVRPVLTVQVRGRRRRLLAMLEHKPWQADEAASWIAAFPWEGPRDDVGEAELEVGALTVDLPPPGGSRRRRDRPAPARSAEAAAELGDEALADRRTASETRHHVQRDLAGARAELGRLRQRHEEESHELHAVARQATERLEELAAQAASATERAEQATVEAIRLREELEREREREGRGPELEQLRRSDAEARAEAARLREAATAAAAEAEQLREAMRTASAEAERLREARDEALAENQRLRQAARRASAEAERLRAASRRPGAHRPAPADAAEPPALGPSPEPDRPPDPRGTVPFPAVPDEPDDDAGVRMPPPTVRRIPRRQPGEAAGAEPAPAPRELPAPRPAAERRTAAIRGRPEPGTGSGRLLGELPRRRSALEVWGPRLAALVLVALLLLALALIVGGIV
jgi:hypothetical protein